MSIPIGSGTEVLKSICGSITSAYTLTPTNDHIYTILNIVIKNNHSSNTQIHLEFSADSGSSYVWLLEDTPMAKDATFVWNDRLVLYDDTARLRITPNGSDALHYMINYIDTDWS
jgi:hypothetical protein